MPPAGLRRSRHFSDRRRDASCGRSISRHAFGDAGANEVADGRSAEVVQDATRASSFRTGRSECDPEALDGPARTVEHARADDFELPLQILGDRSLLFKHVTQLAGHRERASLSIFGLARVEPDLASAEVHLTPLERQDLAVDLIDQLFNSTEKPLARTLLLLARYGEPEASHRALPKVSQEVLAEMVGTTRSQVNFFMNKFRKLGFIDYNGALKINNSLLSVVLRD